MPGEFRADAVLAALAAVGPLNGARVLLPRADIGREVVGDQLRHAGAVVTDVVAYRTSLDERRGRRPRHLSTAARGPHRRRDLRQPVRGAQLRKVYGAEPAADLLKSTVVAVIGPVTADAARQLGIPVTIQASTYTIAALVDGIVAHYAAKATKTV